MKYMKVDIKKFDNQPGVFGSILEARVAVVDMADLANSPYDRMITVDDADNIHQKAKMLDGLLVMLSEARKHTDI